MPQLGPWKSLLERHLSLLKPATFSLATLSNSALPTNPSFTPSSSAPATPMALYPRVRTMVHRGFLFSLPENPKNPLPPPSPHPYASDLLTFTTDSRSVKVGELRSPPSAGGDASIGTFGGAQVEAAYWIAETQNQWRVKGPCYLLAEVDVDSDGRDSTATRKALERRAINRGDVELGEWSWRKEIRCHWGNLAPAMRGTFGSPPEGTRIGVDWTMFDDAKTGGGKELVRGRSVEDKDVEKEDGWEAIARRNMRVGVIVPEVVERIDLGEARRWVWVLEGEEWKEMELWP